MYFFPFGLFLLGERAMLDRKREKDRKREREREGEREREMGLVKSAISNRLHIF